MHAASTQIAAGTPKSVTIQRNRRSLSPGISGHVPPEQAVTIERNTQARGGEAATLQERRQEHVADRILQAAEAGDEGVYAFRQIRIVRKLRRRIGAETLSKEAPVGVLEMTDFFGYDPGKEAQPFTGRWADRHSSTPSRKAIS
ncbi:MAG: hypothetical protein K9L70_12690 [Thiohalocapsa sp.]|nr:hypothetical protein [Thiohalocapsa sp.]